jgi:hypothetical protein
MDGGGQNYELMTIFAPQYPSYYWVSGESLVWVNAKLIDLPPNGVPCNENLETPVEAVILGA